MFYRFLKITIGAAVRIFFREIFASGYENVPSDKPVIFVSNHPSAFLDPLILGIISERDLYFFARADIFSAGFVNWITKKAHMSPIYRSVDGLDSLEKNDAVFAHGYKLLSEKKVLLLFGEGVTDEEFVRRVKTMKKGSMRIALGAERKFDFKLGVNIICVGINYSDPRKFRSDLMVNFSKPIEVLGFRDLFLEHNNKAMLELNREIYARLKNQVIHIENPELTGFFEQILLLSGKGISNENNDRSIPLQKRWEYTKRMEEGFNRMEKESPDELRLLQKKTGEYFGLLKKNDMLEYLNHDKFPNSSVKEAFFLLLTFPVFLAGFLGNFPPVRLSCFLSRKISKRPVFWSGTDMAFSIITVPLYYGFAVLPLLLFAGINIYFSLLMLFLLPFSGIFSFHFLQRFKLLLAQKKFNGFSLKNKTEARNLSESRKLLVEEMEKFFL